MNSVLETLEREPLDTLVQVNTSGEDTKSGVQPKDAIDLARFIHEQCPKLRFAGVFIKKSSTRVSLDH